MGPRPLPSIMRLALMKAHRDGAGVSLTTRGGQTFAGAVVPIPPHVVERLGAGGQRAWDDECICLKYLHEEWLIALDEIATLYIEAPKPTDKGA